MVLGLGHREGETSPHEFNGILGISNFGSTETPKLEFFLRILRNLISPIGRTGSVLALSAAGMQGLDDLTNARWATAHMLVDPCSKMAVKPFVSTFVGYQTSMSKQCPISIAVNDISSHYSRLHVLDATRS